METSPTPRRKWLGWALAGSVALNLFFFGLLGGAWFGDKDRDRDRRGGWSETILAEMPEARRDELRALFMQMREARRVARAGAEPLRDEIDAAMRADPFDRDRLEAAHVAYYSARSEGYDDVRAQFSAFAASLTPEERERFADAMKRASERRKRRQD